MALKLKLDPVRLIGFLFFSCSIVALGCQKSEQIQTYTVPKEVKAVPVAATKTGEPTDRMLAAILPAGDQAWFFKAVGPIADIDKNEKAIKDFFSGLTLADDGRANWKLPAGWKEEAGNDVRIATIVLPGEKRVDITVTRLPWQGTQAGLLANVNRWRDQLQLPKIGPKQLGDVTHEAKAGERPMTIVDMRGQFKAGGMTAPFAGGSFTTSARPRGTNSNLPDGHPPVDRATSQLPAGHPPVDAVTQPAAERGRSSDVPKFDAPKTWKEVAAMPPRKADFIVSDGQQQARVTVTDFAANSGPMISDPLSNINRWRGEVGLAELQQDALADATESVEIDGRPATFAAMIPDAAKPEESKGKEATLAAIVKNGEQIWFVKMKGNRDLVAKHQNEFKAFLKSMKFPANGKAGNGNQ